jgi:hypothetical protein
MMARGICCLYKVCRPIVGTCNFGHWIGVELMNKCEARRLSFQVSTSEFRWESYERSK